MTHQRWERAKQLFAAAIELSPPDRQKLLSRECGADDELQHQVTLLLQQHDNPHHLLTEPLMRIGAHLPERHVPALPDGSCFGRYEIIRPLGSGGMGEVYLAEDTKLHRKVALKLLPAWLSLEPDAIARFELEAFAVSRLNHPNIPVIFEADEVDGQHYIASEFVEGVTLSDRIAQGPIDWRRAITIALQVGRALSAAHKAGVIHRDVKPSNILVRNDGTAKLADFGIAKLIETGSTSSVLQATTVSGLRIGTPGYMSPEQSSGGVIDGRTDIWSLALVIREMLLGTSAEHGPRRLTASLCPHRVSKAVERALEPDKTLRWRSMDELVGELEAALGRAGSLRTRITYFAFAATLCLALAAGYLFHRMRELDREQAFRETRISKLTNSGKVADVAISPDSRYVLYVVDDSGRYSIRLRELATGADIERIGASEAIYSDLTFTPDGDAFYYLRDEQKDFRTLYRASVTQGTAVRVIDDVDSPVAISPDGRQIEFFRNRPAAGDTALFVASRDGSGLRQFAVRPDVRRFAYSGASWSSDGKSVFTGAFDNPEKAGVIQVRIANGRETKLSAPEWRWIGRVSSIAGRRALVFSAAGSESITPQIYQLSLATKRAAAITADLAAYVNVGSSTRNVIAVRDDFLSAIWITHAKESDPVRITPPSGRYWQVSLAPDGSVISQTGEGRELNVWRFSENGSRRQITAGSYVDWGAVSSPDGKQLAFISNREGGLQLWTSDMEGHFMHRLTSGEAAVSSPSFTPDGRIVYCQTAHGVASIHESQIDGGQSRLLLMNARNPEVSPDGRHLGCELKSDGRSPWQTVVVGMQTLRVERVFSGLPEGSVVRWVSNGGALAYITTKNGISNIVAIPLKGNSEKRLTDFREGVIFSFDAARDGRGLALVRGISESDVVLLEGAP